MREMIDEVIRLLEDRMDGVVIETRKVTKNNNQVRMGVCVRPEDGMVGTMYYIDQMVEEGRTEADIAGHISSMYRKHYDTGVETVKSYFVDYESVKGALGLQLVHRDKNAGMLAGMSFKKFLDLAVIITAGVPMRGGGKGGQCPCKDVGERRGGGLCQGIGEFPWGEDTCHGNGKPPCRSWLHACA